MHTAHEGRGALDCGALLCGLEDDFSGVPLNLFAGEPPAEKRLRLTAQVASHLGVKNKITFPFRAQPPSRATFIRAPVVEFRRD